ncbi:MAG: LysE family transporter [Bacteroidales bacterium]|nr:LysE family transporter [Bacteroidales bacterium]MDD6003433.1 LysE family transporter [Bacteroidales bacterium]
MDPTLFTRGIIIGFLAACPIGAVAILCVQKTIQKGFWQGFLMGVGSAFGDFFYAVVTGFSLSFISDFFANHRTIIGIIGGLLMLYLGFSIFRKNPVKQWKENKKLNNTTSKAKVLGDFAASFGLTISNPLTILSFGVLFTASSAISSETPPLETSILLLGVIIGAVIWWAFLALVVNIFRNKIGPRHIMWINKITGICVMLFGLSVITMVIFFPEKLA